VKYYHAGPEFCRNKAVIVNRIAAAATVRPAEKKDPFYDGRACAARTLTEGFPEVAKLVLDVHRRLVTVNGRMEVWFPAMISLCAANTVDSGSPCSSALR
jgi:hypothetical protein